MKGWTSYHMETVTAVQYGTGASMIPAAAKSGLAAFLVAAGVLVPRPAAADWFIPNNFVTQEDLDGAVAEEYGNLTNFAFIYPPRTVIGTNDFFHTSTCGAVGTHSRRKAMSRGCACCTANSHIQSSFT